MICKCEYNDIVDIKEVDQFGFVDLNECMANGQVPSSVSNTEDEYNGIDDPASIMGKPHDVFEAYKMQDYVKSVGKTKTDNKETTTE